MVRRDLLFRLKPLILTKVCPFIGLVAILPTLANANDSVGLSTGDYCDSTKTHLQIEANGTLAATIQQKLGSYARLDCSQSDPVGNLTAELLDVPEHVLSNGESWVELLQYQRDRGDYGEDG